MATLQPNILIIDDDRVSQIYLGELISSVSPNARIAKADNGEKALELIGKTDFDYIFSDIRMPGLSGETLFEELAKATLNCEKCHIYAISGMSDIDSNTITKAGATAVLHKPVNKLLLEQLFYGKKTTQKDEDIKLQTPKQEQLIDPVRIIKLYEQDYTKVAKILSLYQETLPKQMDALQNFWEARNYEEVRSLGHSLKNSFTYLGAEKLKEKAHSLEDVKEGRTEEKYLDSIVQHISGLAKEVEEKIAELIERYEKK